MDKMQQPIPTHPPTLGQYLFDSLKAEGILKFLAFQAIIILAFWIRWSNMMEFVS